MQLQQCISLSVLGIGSQKSVAIAAFSLDVDKEEVVSANFSCSSDLRNWGCNVQSLESRCQSSRVACLVVVEGFDAGEAKRISTPHLPFVLLSSFQIPPLSHDERAVRDQQPALVT